MLGAPVTASVSGSGHFTWMGPSGRVGWRTFSFNARQNADGMVDGRFEMINRGAPEWARGTITCFSTNEDGQAWLEVMVEHASNPEKQEGPRAFWIQDNGEGQSAEPDYITHIRRGKWFYPDWESPGDFCAAQPLEIVLANVVPIEAGNIQVNH